MGSTNKVVGGLLSYFVSKQVVEFLQRINNTIEWRFIVNNNFI